MKYIVMTNRGSLNRKYLELIGLTTKRDRMGDETVIGYKGSGTKLAAIAALRLGIRIGIASTDYLGRYFLSFEWEEVDIGGPKARQVHFRYQTPAPGGDENKVDRYPSNMTVDAYPDWDKPIGHDDIAAFKLFREFLCNAFDEDPTFRVGISEGLRFAASGETSVSIELGAGIERMLEEPDRYFKFLGQRLGRPPTAPVFKAPGVGEIYPKSEPEATRFFVLGVLVDGSTDIFRRTLYDYSLSDKSLVSEDRVITEYHRYLAGVGRLLAALDDADVAGRILLEAATGNAPVENAALGYAASVDGRAKGAWSKAVHAVFGDGICVASGIKQIDNDAEQIYGYRSVAHGNFSLGRFLALLGIPSAADIVPKQSEITFRVLTLDELEKGSRSRFDEAFGLFARHFPARASLPIFLYEPREERMRKWLGFCGTGDRKYLEIWLAAKPGGTLGSVQEIFETLVHEGRHCDTRADDYDRAFVREAEKDLSTVVLRQAGHASFGDGKPLPPEGDATASPPNIGKPAEKTEETVPLPDFDELFKRS